MSLGSRERNKDGGKNELLNEHGIQERMFTCHGDTTELLKADTLLYFRTTGMNVQIRPGQAIVKDNQTREIQIQHMQVHLDHNLF